MDQGSTMKRSAVHNFAPTVTKFCVMWEGQALPHDTKFGNSRCEIVGRRVIFIWSLIHGSSWSGNYNSNLRMNASEILGMKYAALHRQLPSPKHFEANMLLWWAIWHNIYYNSYCLHRVGIVKSLVSVCTFKQNIGGTPCSSTNMKSKRNMSRSD